MKILQADECYNFRRSTQSISHGLQRHCIARSTVEKSYCQVTFEENTRKPYNDNLCLFRALVLHLQINQRLEKKTSNLFNLFLEKTRGTDPTNFRGSCMEDIAAVQDITQEDIFLYDIDIVDGSMIGELAGRSVGKNTLILYGYYVGLVTFAMPPISTLSSKPIVARRVFNLSKGLII